MDSAVKKFKDFLEAIMNMYSPTSHAYQKEGKKRIKQISDFLEFSKVYKQNIKLNIDYYLSEKFNNINLNNLDAELNIIAIDYYNKVKSDFFDQ